jgi:hypothetical protein
VVFRDFVDVAMRIGFQTHINTDSHKIPKKAAGYWLRTINWPLPMFPADDATFNGRMAKLIKK